MAKRWIAVLLCAAATAFAAGRVSKWATADPLIAAASAEDTPEGAQRAGSGRGGAPAPPAPRYRGPLPPIPFSPHAAAPSDVLQAVYEFAARRPDVMRYVPCFCGCERNGHQDNEDCFVARRDPDGRPYWDAHGLT